MGLLGKIVTAVSERAERVQQWTEEKWDQAMRCPECGHGPHVTPYCDCMDCECADERCLCNPANEVSG